VDRVTRRLRQRRQELGGARRGSTAWCRGDLLAHGGDRAVWSATPTATAPRHRHRGVARLGRRRAEARRPL